MLFDIHPKENRADLYNRKKELESLSESLRLGERLVIIYGVRRTGKTSLMHVFLNGRSAMYVLLDVKQIYFEQGYVPLKIISGVIGREFIKISESLGLDADIPADFIDLNFTEMLKEINVICKSRKLKFIVALDEAQYLRFGGNIRYDGIIAWAVDNLANVMFILTGSEIGTLKDFLRYEDAKAPLFGRFRNEIYLERFDKKAGMDFLSRGFSENKKAVSDSELENVTDTLDGIVGWLAYYGYYRAVAGHTQKEALNRVFKEGSKLVETELKELISKSRSRYLAILNAMVEGPNSWSNIKAYTYAKTGKITDSRLTEMLQSLVKFGIVDKVGELYAITDPIIKHTVRTLKSM